MRSGTKLISRMLFGRFQRRGWRDGGTQCLSLGLSLATDARHPRRAQDLRRKLPISSSLSLRRRCANVARDLPSCNVFSRGSGEEERSVPLEPFTVHDLRRTSGDTVAPELIWRQNSTLLQIAACR